MPIRRYTLLIVLVLFSFSPLFCNIKQIEQVEQELVIAEQQDVIQEEKVQNSWDKVSALYLPSLFDVSEKKKSLNLLAGINNSSTDESSVIKIKKESVRLKEALTPDSVDFIKHILAYYSNKDSSKTDVYDESKTIFDDTTFLDLNVFCGNNDTLETNLFNFINHTQTHSGKSALLNILYNPLVDIKLLLERQAAVKKLVEDEQLYELIHEKLEIIKNAENSLFLLLNDASFKLLSDITDRFYLSSIFDLPVISSIMAFPFISFIREIDRIPYIKKIGERVSDKFNKKAHVLEFFRFENFLKSFVITPISSSVMFYKLFGGSKAYKEILDRNYSQAIKPGALFASLMLGLGFACREIIRSTVDQLKSEKILHKTVSSLTKMAVASRDLQEIIKQNPELEKLGLLEVSDSDEVDLEFKKFLMLSEDEVFEKETSWKSPKGKMIAALKFISTFRHKLMQSYLNIGKLDAITSVATLYNKYATNPNARYYFANYKQQSTPYISLNNFWNPFIDADTVITNSIELGTKDNHRNILITGPNAGGKSTALKAIAFAVLLSETLTVSNADIVITPFSKLFTTLNITDSVGKESLYQADKNRIKKVISELKELKDDEKALLISDEMFNSTGASYGAALFYGTLNYIDEVLKNTVFIAATHFENLVELEEDTKGSVANFRVDEAKVGENGKLSWTYKIKPGINEQNISFELAGEGGFEPKILIAGMRLLKRHSVQHNMAS